jgi:hypothetical protein
VTWDLYLGSWPVETKKGCEGAFLLLDELEEVHKFFARTALFEICENDLMIIFFGDVNLLIDYLPQNFIYHEPQSV